MILRKWRKQGEWDRQTEKANISVLLKFLLWAMELILFCQTLQGNIEAAPRMGGRSLLFTGSHTTLVKSYLWECYLPWLLAVNAVRLPQHWRRTGEKVSDVAVCLSSGVLKAWGDLESLWHRPLYLWVKWGEARKVYTRHQQHFMEGDSEAIWQAFGISKGPVFFPSQILN